MERSVNTLEAEEKSTSLKRNIIGHVLAEGNNLALWRLPHAQEQQLIFSKTSRYLGEKEALEELPAGFMISPFLPDQARQFIPADYLLRFTENNLLPPASSEESNTHTWLQQQTMSSATQHIPFYTKPTPAGTTTTKNEYLEVVNKCVEQIEKGIFEKIVPSRCKEIPNTFDLLDAYNKLCIKYPAAMVSLISSKETGTWLGATPEVLVSIENNTIFKTIALAGTKAWQENTDIKNVAWTQKEIEEQALVERYIISCFKKIRLREYDEHGPKTVVAGNLMHLKSDFTVDMKATNFPLLGSVMLSLLHPTSAVCGMPKEAALQFLLDHEQYPRELYSGYLGPVNLMNNTHLFVNLRCLQWFADKIRLYAGAGVTIDSVAEKEWEETELKMNTLESVIH